MELPGMVVFICCELQNCNDILCTESVCFIGRNLGIQYAQQLALEKDGTIIDDDIVLQQELEKGSILILLCEGEKWKPA